MSEFEMDFDSEIGLGDDDKDKVRSNKFEWYKAEKGRVDLVSIVYFHTFEFNAVKKARKLAREAGKDLTPEQMKEVAAKARAAQAQKLNKPLDELDEVDMLDTSEVAFKVHDVIYAKEQGLGSVISRMGKDGAEADAAWKKLPASKTQVSTLLLKYPTNSDGEIDKSKLANGWKLIPWKFGEDKYEMIRKVNKTLSKNGLSIAGQDLKIECSDTNFQKITMEGEGSAIWIRNEGFRRRVLEKAIAFYGNRLVPGKEITSAELREKLGMSAPASSGGDVSGEDFSAYLANV